MLLQTWLAVFALYLLFLYLVEGFCLFVVLSIVRWDGKLSLDDLLHPEEMVTPERAEVHLNARNLQSFAWMLGMMLVAFFNSLVGLFAVKSAFRPMPTFRKCLWIAVPISFLPLFPLHLIEHSLFEWISTLVTVFVAASTMILLSLAIFTGLMEKEFHERSPRKNWTLWNVLCDT